MITIFRNVREITTPYYTTLQNVIDRIRSGNSRELITKIQAENDKKVKQELKTGLPSILFAGDFPNRKPNAVPKTHSGLIILDIDELGNYSLTEIGAIIKADKFTHCAFISPSGQGYKVLVKIPADTKRHVGYFLGLEKYYLEKYDIILDPTGKNIGRVCYESYDPDIYYNEDSETFKDYIEPIKSQPKTSKVDVFSIKSEDKIINNVTTWWNKNFNFSAGRNAAIYQLASALNRFGVAESSALSHCLQYVDYSRPKDPFDSNEITRVVSNVYSQQANKHGSETMEDSEKRKSVADEIMGQEPEQAAEILSEFEGFENFSPTELENTAVEIQEQDKKEKKNRRDFWYYDDGKLKIDIKSMIDFINELGYYVYYPSKTPNAYVFIKIENRKIKIVDEREIKTEVLEYINDKKQNIVYNLVSDRVKYWTKSFLNALPVIDPPILKDTKKVSFIPTPSGVFKITKKAIEKIDYVDLTEGYVWEAQITDKNFDYVGQDEAITGDFAKFLQFVGGEKLERLLSIIGYLLHNFKDPSESKNVIIYDKNISQINGEPEGGSGKSLILEGVKFLRDVAAIHGDRVDFKKQFLFQEITESTQIAWIDELPQNFDMAKLFSRTTNGLPIEKKNMAPIFIENVDAPKFVFTSNYKPKGTSGSHMRRRIDFSVTNYFNQKHTPRDEFNNSFFTEWDDNEWNKFFSFYLECLKKYLNSGIVNVEDKDDVYLTILSECGQDFTEYWIDEGNLNTVLNFGKFNARQHYEALLLEHELTTQDISIKKYLICIRKMLSLHSISFTEEGKRKYLEFKFL